MPTRLRRLLWLLIVVDLALIALSVVISYTPSIEFDELWNRFLLGRDHGVPESLNHLKWLAVAILLGWTARSRRSVLFAALSWLFVITFLDDFLLLHENWGVRLADSLGFGDELLLRARDFGELAVWAVLGLIGFVPVVWSYTRSTGIDRREGGSMIALYIGLIFFAVILDMVHIAIPEQRDAKIIVATLEDGGEMLIGSVMVAVAAALALRKPLLVDDQAVVGRRAGSRSAG